MEEASGLGPEGSRFESEAGHVGGAIHPEHDDASGRREHADNVL